MKYKIKIKVDSFYSIYIEKFFWNFRYFEYLTYFTCYTRNIEDIEEGARRQIEKYLVDKDFKKKLEGKVFEYEIN